MRTQLVNCTKWSKEIILKYRMNPHIMLVFIHVQYDGLVIWVFCLTMGLQSEIGCVLNAAFRNKGPRVEKSTKNIN